MDEQQKNVIASEVKQSQNQDSEIASPACAKPELRFGEGRSPKAPRNDSCEKCNEYLEGWKRAQADYQNLKKETEREKADFAKYANERLLSELLPALDQFAFAMHYVPSADADPTSREKWLIGLRAVQSLWEQAAKSAGLERITSEGNFDPVRHEAVGEESVETLAAGSIVRVMQDGWMLHGKVLRPTKVIISK